MRPLLAFQAWMATVIEVGSQAGFFSKGHTDD